MRHFHESEVDQIRTETLSLNGPAQCKLAELGLSITCSDDADAILNLLHERELHDHTSCRADGLALKKLASVVATVLGHDDA